MRTVYCSLSVLHSGSLATHLHLHKKRVDLLRIVLKYRRRTTPRTTRRRQHSTKHHHLHLPELTPSGHFGRQSCLLSKIMFDGPRGEYGGGVALAATLMTSARRAEMVTMDFMVAMKKMGVWQLLLTRELRSYMYDF